MNYNISLTYSFPFSVKDPGLNIAIFANDDVIAMHTIDLFDILEDLIGAMNDKDGLISGEKEIRVSKRYQKLFVDLASDLKAATKEKKK